MSIENFTGVDQGLVGAWMGTDDGALVEAAKSGDKTAFEILVVRHERKLLFTAMRITGNREDAEDVVQQTFQKAFVYLPDFEGRSSFSTWLTRIVLNEALMLKRSGRRSREVSMDDAPGGNEASTTYEFPDRRPDPEHDYFQNERRQILFSAMGELRPGMRAALHSCEIEERSARETARMLGLSISAVKSRVNRGRKILREKLKHHMAPAGVVHANRLRPTA